MSPLGFILGSNLLGVALLKSSSNTASLLASYSHHPMDHTSSDR
jgi:hypothetical protein